MDKQAHDNNLNQVREKLKELLVEYAILDKPVDEIDLNEEIHTAFINSILFIKIVVALETEFEFEFADEDLDVDKFRTLDNIAENVCKIVNK